MQLKLLLRCSRGLGNAKTVDHGFNGVRFFPSTTHDQAAPLLSELDFPLRRVFIPTPTFESNPIPRTSSDLNPAQVACPVRKLPSPRPERCARNTTINNEERVNQVAREHPGHLVDARAPAPPSGVANRPPASENHPQDPPAPGCLLCLRDSAHPLHDCRLWRAVLAEFDLWVGLS